MVWRASRDAEPPRRFRAGINPVGGAGRREEKRHIVFQESGKLRETGTQARPGLAQNCEPKAIWRSVSRAVRRYVVSFEDNNERFALWVEGINVQEGEKSAR